MNRSTNRGNVILIIRVATIFLSVSGLAGQTPKSSSVNVKKIAPTAAYQSDLRLVQAAEKGDKEAVRSLLKQHAAVNTPQADGMTALAWAAHRDDLETAELLIRSGANVNAATDLGVSPLSLACTNRNTALIEALLKVGANANAVLGAGETVLMTCAATGNMDAVKLLLDHGADVNAKENKKVQSALMWAIAGNHPKVAHELITHGADVHARSKSGFTPLLFAAQQGNADSTRVLLEAGENINEAAPDGMTPLLVASASGHEQYSIFLLDQGADPNAADNRGITALHFAVQKGMSIMVGVKITSLLSFLFRPNMVELVKALLAHGANPNPRLVGDPHWSDVRQPQLNAIGATPFLMAAASFDANVMRVLAAGGADPRLATNENTTALILAAGMGRRNHDPRTEEEEKLALEAVKVAVELGVDPNAADVRGQTPLHAAAYGGSDAIIQFLVEKGAKVDVTDKYGQTPWSIAAKIITPGLGGDGPRRPRAVHQSTADLLLKLGATPMKSESVTTAGGN